jgi:hypothetical protein
MAFVARFPYRDSLLRTQDRIGIRVERFGTCSAFTHVMACQLVKSPTATLYIEGFSRFVTSTTAPITTGWSDSCRAGLARWKTVPLHGALEIGSSVHRMMNDGYAAGRGGECCQRRVPSPEDREGIPQGRLT